MKNLAVNLKNCYGIKKLDFVFDFVNGNAHLVYAPNGAMKSSFARVFIDICNGATPTDRIFPERKTEYHIQDENGNDVNEDTIFVVDPYIEDFESDKISTLLVSKKLREEYEKIHNSISIKLDEFLGRLGPYFGMKDGVPGELLKEERNKDLYALFESYEAKLKDGDKGNYSAIIYSEIFNEKVLAFLETKDFKKQIMEYVQKYNELIESSKYFRKGIFNHNNAETVSDVLKDNGFFDAKHSLFLNNSGEKSEVSTQEELVKVIDDEKKRILTDPELSKRFNAIDKAIKKNKELRQFRIYLENNPEILPELQDLSGFKKKLFLSYFKAERQCLEEFLALYRSSKPKIVKIVKQAKKEETEWAKVVDEFNKRFSVPFKVEIGNQDDVILQGKAPSNIFKYEDKYENRQAFKEIGKGELKSVLSIGEKRALYILDVIFEIEARKKLKEKTILVIDDIADSFDYKNKYAIVEYLKDNLDSQQFYMIILTHNFDFFRTVQSRLDIDRDKNCHMTIKTDEMVKLVKAEYVRNAFKYWKTKFASDDKMLIAAISFVRNLIEYTYGDNHPDYLQLTSLVHIKNTTDTITVGDLEDIYNRVLNLKLSRADKAKKVIHLIFESAEGCLTASESINLENKIVLSIAIRLYAEKYMIAQINDSVKTSNIKNKQTTELFNMFKQLCLDKTEEIRVLDRVNLMTPENIHLNSFMYEPILDISDHHLKDLLCEVKRLK